MTLEEENAGLTVACDLPPALGAFRNQWNLGGCRAAFSRRQKWEGCCTRDLSIASLRRVVLAIRTEGQVLQGAVLRFFARAVVQSLSWATRELCSNKPGRYERKKNTLA